MRAHIITTSHIITTIVVYFIFITITIAVATVAAAQSPSPHLHRNTTYRLRCSRPAPSRSKSQSHALPRHRPLDTTLSTLNGMSTAGGAGGAPNRRSSRAVPAFHGTNLIHSNPLPPVSNLPSFSYGSPQTALPKPISVRDTKVAITDALEAADAAAKARLEAAAHERRLAEERSAAEAAARASAEASESNPPQRAARMPNASRKRSLRSQSVLSRACNLSAASVPRTLLSENGPDGSDDDGAARASEDNFYEGDETSLEIHRIIASAKNPFPDSSMLRSRSVNAGTKEPRSAMKGSREEALRPSAKTRAKHMSARRTKPQPPVPVRGERDATFDEENQAIGLVHRVPSSIASGSPTPTPPDLPGVPEDEPVDFGGRGDSPPDTFDHGDVPNESSGTTSTSNPSSTERSAKGTKSAKLSFRPSLPFAFARNGFRTVVDGAKKTVVIMWIFASNLFGPLLKYLLLGFFIFGITTLSYGFIQRSTSYTAPFLPPTSAEEVSRRLMEVERQLGSLSRAYDKGAKRWDSFSETEKDQMASVKSILAAYSSLSHAMEQHTRGYQNDRRTNAAAMSTMNAQLDNLDKTVKKSDSQHKQDAGRVRDQLTKMQGQMKEVDAELKRLKQSQELGDKALRSIEAMLPKQIAARLDPETGKIIVAPELLRYLQSVLRKDIQDEISKLGPSTGGGKVVGGSTVMASWDEFLKVNAAKMKGYLGQMSDEKWKEAIADGIVVSKEDMMRLIRDEFNSVRGIAEKDNKELMKQLLSQAEGVAKNVASTAATSISSAALAAASNYVRNAKGGGSASKYADALIQAALHQYSSTVLRKPDYALFARGSLIDPRLTSSTFDPYGKPGLLGTFSTFLRSGPNEPAHVLTESTNVGDCWSFPQASGQVSILLAEDIHPTDVTIDHVPRGISGDDSSAPREIEFWVRVEDEIVRGQVAKAAAVAIGDVADNPSARQYVVNGYVRIASFIYDVNSQYPTQTFELPVNLARLGVSVRGVSFRVLSNWGNEEYTSIYRLRVHGDPVAGRGGDSSQAAEEIKPL
ncbi:hypothetical protein Dda_5864 [Drechslerella dactyloides]|uniref:SUN domain-containing protein n=1 Tax=Drechslerella dactyloides TaxID=74499 RepID=A0AAD6NHY6_DREDA|nr:hypothetical protein Dda_5864 [Drechslerella dactyloides]